MKDKIKYLLVMVVHAMNVPFFVVRVLIIAIPMIVGSMVADYTNYDDYFRFVASMLVAAYISGPIGMISRMLMRKMYKIDNGQLRDYLIERIKKEYYK